MPTKKKRGRKGGGGKGGGRGGPVIQYGPEITDAGRLHKLTEFLLLKVLNLLDNKSRINGFRAMGWSTKRYIERRANLKRQTIMKKKNEKEMQERMEWREGLFKNVLSVGLKDKDVPDDKPLTEEMAKASLSEDTKEGDKDKDAADDTEKPLTEEMAKASVSEDTKEGDREEKELLPHLGTRIDPVTLLTRLNTRRLYRRLKYYKKVENERRAEKKKRNDELRNKGVNVFLDDSIVSMYDRKLKMMIEKERIWPKNMTILEIARKEWLDLLEDAKLRYLGDVGAEPIPTQYELLLFQQCPRAVAVLASYPRSGNSLMRTLYEHTTLRVTGSDMQGGLAQHDLVGEMAVGARMVQFVKTHYPERMGSSAFQCCRAVLLVRNPFDCIESYFHLMMTGKHTASLSEEMREKAMAYFDEYAVKEAQVWTKFHEYWLSQDIPILLVRYEDLYRETDKVMERTLQFALEVKHMDQFFMNRIDRCIREQQEIEKLGSYKPRSAGIGKSLNKYKPEVIERMKTPAMVKVMEKLGYSYLLENPVEMWSKMPPLAGHATELMSAKAFVKQNLITLNNDYNAITRTQALQTPFKQIKSNIGIVDDECNCDECAKRRQFASNNVKNKYGETV